MKENNFKFKKNFYTVMRDMTDKQAGEFVKGVCGYVFDGKPFTTKDDLLKGVFLYVKRELDVSRENSVNGRKGGLISAEIRRNEEQENAYKEAMFAGSVVAEHAMEILVNCLKNGSENGEGNDGEVGKKEEKGEAG